MNTNDAKFNKKNFLSEFLFLSILLVVSCAIMYYFVKPLCKEVKLAKLEISLKEKNIKSKELLLVGINDVSNNEKVSENIEKIKNLIPSKNNYEDYLVYIVKLASSKNIVVNSFSIETGQSNSKTKTEKLNEAEIDASFSGGFLNFMSFLRDIENGIPFVQVESVSFSGGEEEDEMEEKKDDLGLMLNQEVNLKFYYY